MTSLEFGITAVFALCGLFSFFEKKRKSWLKCFFVGAILLVLLLICTFKPVYQIWDAEAYVYRYKYLEYSEMGSEPFSYLLIRLTRPFGCYTIMFFAYALLGLSFKFLAIWRSTNLFFLSLVIFISHLFFCQDLIQIRTAVAVSILLFSVPYLVERDIWKFLLCTVMATLFHYSAVVWLFTYVLNPYKINKVFWLCGMTGSYALSLAGFRCASLIEKIPFDTVQDLYQGYVYKIEFEGAFMRLNLFSLLQLAKMGVLLLLFFRISSIAPKSPYAIVLLKIYAASMFLFTLLADLPVVAVRMSEVLQVVSILLFPMLAYAFKQRVMGMVVVLLVGIMFLFGNIYMKSLYTL